MPHNAHITPQTLNFTIPSCAVLSHAVVSDTLWPHGLQPTRLLCAFPRQEHWSGLSFSLPGDLPDPAIEPTATTLAGRFSPTEPPGKLSGSQTSTSKASPLCRLCLSTLPDARDEAVTGTPPHRGGTEPHPGGAGAGWKGPSQSHWLLPGTELIRDSQRSDQKH